MKLKSEFLREINSRGFIYQSSDIENLDSLVSKKKIVLITGAESGIGKSTTKVFLDNGYRVIGTCLKNNKNKDTNKPFNESLDDSAPFLEFNAIKKKTKPKPMVPDDILVKMFYASFGVLGLVILFKLFKKRK